VVEGRPVGKVSRLTLVTMVAPPMTGMPARSTSESCQLCVKAMMRPARNCAKACMPSPMRRPVPSWKDVAALHVCRCRCV
jgi:hypothetical protein